MKIAICDDQIQTLKESEQILRSLDSNHEISAFSNISYFLQLIKERTFFDIIFMDIEWRLESNGIDFAAEIYRYSPKSNLVFISNHSEKYLEHFFSKTHNLKDIIRKPLRAERALEAIQNIRRNALATSPQKLVIAFNGIITSIDTDNILYIESRGHTSTIHTAQNSYRCYKKLSSLADDLPGNFTAPHKSFYINMDYVKQMENDNVVLQNGYTVPISRRKAKEVRERYFRYIGTTI